MVQLIQRAIAPEHTVDSPRFLALPPAARLLPVVENLPHHNPPPAPEERNWELVLLCYRQVLSTEC